MMKYYKTGNGYVASVGKIDGFEVAKEEFDKQMDRIKNGIENEPTPPTLEGTVESLKEAVASQRKEMAYTRRSTDCLDIFIGGEYGDQSKTVMVLFLYLKKPEERHDRK